MDKIIYSACDGTGMTTEDLLCWLCYAKRSSQYHNCTFDELTGGLTEFVSNESYFNAKSEFEYIQNEFSSYR